MNRLLAFLLPTIFALLAPGSLSAQGEVTLPLAEYEALIARARGAGDEPDHSLASATTAVIVAAREGGYEATVRSQIELQRFVDEPALVRLLGPDAVIEAVTVGGSPAQLLALDEGYFIHVSGPRAQQIDLRYRQAALQAGGSWSIPLALARAASHRIDVRFESGLLEPLVAPAHALLRTSASDGVRYAGHVPATARLALSWRDSGSAAVILERARYSGQLRGDAVRWVVEVDARVGRSNSEIRLFGDDIVVVEFDAPEGVVLQAEQGYFLARFAQPGRAPLRAVIESAIADADGAPHTALTIPRVPVSRFELDLPGDKSIVVTPAANVSRRSDGQTTAAEFFVPLGDFIDVAWMEAIPDDVAVERRMSATVHQALMAAEGLLSGRAELRYEISRGSLNVARFTLPASADVNLIDSPSAEIADWFVVTGAAAAAPADGARTYEVYFNRAISTEVVLVIDYEQLLGDASSKLAAPLIFAAEVDRQKGMLALLAGRDLALEPSDATAMVPVGENQLPAEFRNALGASVSHTFKYHDTDAAVAIAAVEPRRQPARFDVELNALVSVGEVALRGQLGALVDVKSGRLETLTVLLPDNLNVLAVTGPAIRNYVVIEGDQQRSLAVEFTRELEGRFQLDMVFERIVDPGSATAAVPMFEVPGADVEHGLVAIEALAALEITVDESPGLTMVDVAELPRALVLKTTNPILHAFRYVRSEQPPRLVLNVTRHRELELKDAMIDEAAYQTLMTRDGLAVTRAAYQVRNSRRQFLRVRLPQGATVWSAFVNGESRKPARADDQPDGRDILIKMINSAAAFEVQLVYAVDGEEMTAWGQLSATLPQPDVTVTHTLWGVYVPHGPRYAEPTSSLEFAQSSSMRDARELFAAPATGQPGALQIQIPTQGVHYAFSKLYADQGQPAWFEVAYVTGEVRAVGAWLGVAAALLAWIAIVLLLRGGAVATTVAAAVLAIGLFGIAVGPLGASAAPAASIALLGGVVAGAALLIRWWRARREGDPTEL